MPLFKKNKKSHQLDQSLQAKNPDLATESDNPSPSDHPDGSQDSATQTLSSKKTQRRKFNFWPKTRVRQIALILTLIFCVFLGTIGVLGAYTFRVGTQMMATGNEIIFSAQTAKDRFSQQNLPETEQHILQAQEQLNTLVAQHQQLNLYSSIPVAKNYYQDSKHALTAAEHGLDAAVVAIQAITPYTDILGFEGEGSFEGGTAEDRIGLLLQTLEMITPDLDEIETNLVQAQTNLAQIDASRYPETVRDMAVREQIVQAQDTLEQSITIFQEFRPVIEELPSIAGSQGERRKYLILFQNNNELRPTGGFLTAYSIVYIENGKVQPEKSDDIYELDQRFNQRIEIPESLGKYLTTERYWNLRDMNISPDFKESMDIFFEHYQTIRGEPDDIDGIFAVDTHVLTRLLEILGPVEVPGYGTFSSEIDQRCDCPQVVYALSEIITRPTPYLREDRKGILGPMMQAILLKTYGAPRQHFADLFEMIWNTIQGRNIQMYFVEDQPQQAAENAGAAGRMKTTEGDFLAIVDANLGGAKSNLFTEYEVQQLVDGPENGYITNTLEITYRNTRKADNCNLEAGQLCLNAPAPTWNRLYLPLGSELVQAQGYTEEPSSYEELGFQVIDGFFVLDPLGMAKIRLTYKVPYELETYQLYVWKQGGVKPYPLIVDVNGNQAELIIDRDTTYQDTFF